MTDEELLNEIRPPGDEAAVIPDLEAPAVPEIGGPSPVAPNPAAAFEAPLEGPPAPDPTDALASALPPPAPGIPTRDQDKEIAPAVPREAPGMVPAGGAPAAPGAPVAPGNGTNGIEGALSDVEASRKDADAAKLEQFRGQQVEKQSQDQAHIDFLAARRAQLEEQQKQADATAKLDAAADAKAQASVAASDAAIKNFKFKDLWDSKTTAQKVGSALGMALLAIGAGMMKTPKYAIEILDKEKRDDHERQLDQLHGLQDDYVRQRTGMADAVLGRKKMAADIQLGNARKNEIIAAQFEETAARAKDPNAANDATVYATKLKAEADQDRLGALTTLRQLHLKDDADARLAELQQAQIHNLNESAALKSRGLGQGHKAGGTGGGGGGAASHGETLLMQKIEEYKKANGNAMPSQGTIYGWADDPAIKLPHEAKAGHPSVVNVLALTGKIATTGATENRAGLQRERFDEATVKNFSAQHQLPKLEAAHRKLEEVRHALDSGNPTAAMSALMEYDAAAKGAAATESSMHAIQERLGGAWDQFKGWAEKKQTGNFGAEQLKNLKGAVDIGIKGFRDSVEPIHRAYYERFDGSQPGVKERASSLFSPYGYREKGGGEQAQGDPRIAKARAAVKAGSGATDVQRQNAQAFLDAHGG